MGVAGHHPLQWCDRCSFQARQRARSGTVPEVRHGPRFMSRAILQKLTGVNIDMEHRSRQVLAGDRSNESINGKFGDECLRMRWVSDKFAAFFHLARG
jgi:hypothetical protein